MRKYMRILLAVVLCAAMLAGTVSGAFAAPERAPLQVGVVSDIHYFAEKMTGNWCDAFMQWQAKDFHERYETPALLDSALTALAAHAKENGMKYVLLPGDLSANGEYDAHAELAQRLEQFEQETGLSVIVINGNHDINNYNAFTFEGGQKRSARRTTPEEFRELYKNLGFDLAYHTFIPKSGKAGMLSYSVQLNGGYRLIVLDVCRYSADVSPKGKDYAEVGGQITDELMQWALDEIADAKASGEAVIGMEHHSLVEHFRLHTDVFQPFTVDDWQERAEAFADAGLSYMLTGHLHDVSVSDHVSDEGNVLYDVSTPSLTGFPNYFREICFDNTGDVLTADVQTFDVDCVKPVTIRGVEMEQPFRYYSFNKSYKGTISDLALSGLTEIFNKVFGSLESDGSLLTALKTGFNIDVQALVEKYVHVRLGSIDIFTEKNVMSFLDDLDKQVQEKILKSRTETEALVRRIVDKAVAFRVSDLPCDKYLDTYGFGHTSGPSTLEDAAYSTLVDQYEGNQTLEDDPFLQDVVNYFRNSTGGEDFARYLYEIVLQDVLEDTLLSKLQLNLDTLFPSGTLGHVSMSMFDGLLSLVLRGDKSYTNVLNAILGLGIFPEFEDIDSAAAYFAAQVATPAQMQAWGETIAFMIEDLMVDHGDGEDLTRLLVPTVRTPEATQANDRLPTLVTVTPGEDAATSRTISWYTKFSVTGSDVELVPYSENPSFSGVPTRSGVTGSCTRHDRAYPGVDLGLIGMMQVMRPLNRHVVQITGLEKGQRYSFRVGDAAKGWWSEPGVLQTARDGSVTMLHIADARVQSRKGAETLHSVLQAAQKLFDRTDLILSSGDQVVNGANVKQWNDFLDGSADVLTHTMLLPAAGGHEGSADALGENFILSGVPEQDTESGTYYAVDYGNVHVMVLNTNDANSKSGLSDAQTAWLRESAQGSDAQWKIVVLHKAPYAAGAQQEDQENEALRKQLKGLLPQIGVDLVLAGQDRAYLRTGALYNGIAFRTKTETLSASGRDYTAQVDPCGTYYVVSGTAGSEPLPLKKSGSLCALLSGSVTHDVQKPMFSAIRAEGSTLYFDAYAVAADGSTERVDSFAIEKTGAKKSPAEAAADAQPVPMLGTLENLDAPVLSMAEIIGEMDMVPDSDTDTNPNPEKLTPEQIEELASKAAEEGQNSDPTTPGSSAETGDPQSGANGAQTQNDAQGAPSVPGVVDSASAAAGSGSTSPSRSVAIGGGTRTGGVPGSDAANPNDGVTLPGGSNAGDPSAAGDDAEDADTQGTPNSIFSFLTPSASNDTTSTIGSTGIPKLGGSAPVATVSVLFGAMLVAMLTARRKEDE